MSFHRGLLISGLLLGLGMVSSCGKTEPTSANGGGIPQGLSSDTQRCMDTQIDQIIKTSPGDDVKAVNDGFPAALKACSMTELWKNQYLAYTNVLAGVLPDSVGDDGFSELKTVISTQNLRRGTIEELFTNGWAVVRWDGDPFTTTVKQVEISPQVRSRRGVALYVEVIGTQDGRKGVAYEVFAIGVAYVKFVGQTFGTMVKVSDIGPRVDCLNGFCTMSDVIHNTSLRRGYLTAIYANSKASVRWNTESFDAIVNLNEIAARVPR